MLDGAGIHVGDEVDVSVTKGRGIVEPASRIRGRYDLKALVSKMPEEYRPEEPDWGPPVGKESWWIATNNRQFQPRQDGMMHCAQVGIANGIAKCRSCMEADERMRPSRTPPSLTEVRPAVAS